MKVRATRYIVYGFAGAWETSTEWAVACLRNKDEADALAEKLNDWCIHRGYDKYTNFSRGKLEKTEDDPNFRIVYGEGTYYAAVEEEIWIDG